MYFDVSLSLTPTNLDNKGEKTPNRWTSLAWLFNRAPCSAGCRRAQSHCGS